jgi:hypothetical protein
MITTMKKPSFEKFIAQTINDSPCPPLTRAVIMTAIAEHVESTLNHRAEIIKKMEHSVVSGSACVDACEHLNTAIAKYTQS